MYAEILYIFKLKNTKPKPEEQETLRDNRAKRDQAAVWVITQLKKELMYPLMDTGF